MSLMIPSLLRSVVGTLLLAGILSAAVPKVGDQAPPIAAPDQDGKPWSLAAETGKSVVLLYFYPKDDTPGCTKEACGLRDRMGDLQKGGVKVVGVSFDSAESHQKFRAKYSLNFPLLVDTDGKIADAFGVRMPDKPMARRVSFLINKDGKIVHVTDSRDAQVHLDEMKEAIRKLN
jgi:peroxiredoxin Q/BCP